jgi:hypothetical protein
MLMAGDDRGASLLRRVRADVPDPERVVHSVRQDERSVRRKRHSWKLMRELVNNKLTENDQIKVTF